MRIITQYLRGWRERPGVEAVDRAKGRWGFSLIETLIALGILGFIGVAFMAALNTSFKATDIVSERVRAENLARSVLEYVRSKSYLADYNCPPETGCPTAPIGYSYTLTTAPFCSPEPCTPDGNIQKNTVRVSRGAEGLIILSDLKALR